MSDTLKYHQRVKVISGFYQGLTGTLIDYKEFTYKNFTVELDVYPILKAVDFSSEELEKI